MTFFWESIYMILLGEKVIVCPDFNKKKTVVAINTFIRYHFKYYFYSTHEKQRKLAMISLCFLLTISCGPRNRRREEIMSQSIIRIGSSHIHGEYAKKNTNRRLTY